MPLVRFFFLFSVTIFGASLALADECTAVWSGTDPSGQGEQHFNGAIDMINQVLSENLDDHKDTIQYHQLADKNPVHLNLIRSDENGLEMQVVTSDGKEKPPTPQRLCVKDGDGNKPRVLTASVDVPEYGPSPVEISRTGQLINVKVTVTIAKIPQTVSYQFCPDQQSNCQSETKGKGKSK